MSVKSSAVATTDEGSAGKNRAHLWKPGQSGNPLGMSEKSRASREVALLAREYTVDAIDLLGKMLKDKKISAIARIKAAEVLLDRGYGRAPLMVNITHGLDPATLEATARAILQKREKKALVVEAELIEPGLSEQAVNEEPNDINEP